MIRFMRDASEHTEYHRELAGLIMSRLQGNPVVCDAGCGLGYLSIALSENAKSVIALDSNPDPLAVLAENIKKRKIGNITPVCADLNEYEPDCAADAVVFCFCGDGKLISSSSKRFGAKKVFVIGKSRDARESKEEGITDMLGRLGVPYETEFFELSLDQPFRSKEDALLFLNTYRMKEPYSGMSDEEYLAGLAAGPDAEFPLKLPIKKFLRMTLFNPGDLPR